MKTYITKPKSVRKSKILNKFYSFLPSEHRIVNIENPNCLSIQNLVEFEGVGEQINVQEYLNFKSDYWLATISCMSNLIFDETSGEKVSPYIYKKSSKKLKKGILL